MPVIAYPDHLPTFLKASKTRRQGAAFSAEEVRRGYAYFKKTGPDVPVYWDVTFRFNRFQAIQFWLWFTLKLRRGINEFTIPIDTEGTLSTHRCRFVPDSLLPAQEYGGVWTYTATIESRSFVQGNTDTAFLLDTFTAPNGTDFSERNLNSVPYFSGSSSWQLGSPQSAFIYDNKLRLNYSAVADERSFFALIQNTENVIAEEDSLFIMMIAESTGSVLGEQITFGFSVPETFEFGQLRVTDGGRFVFDASNADGSASITGEYFQELGVQHKFGLHFFGGTASAILNGSVVNSVSGLATPRIQEIYLSGSAFVGDAWTNKVFVDEVRIESGIALSDAISLTV